MAAVVDWVLELLGSRDAVPVVATAVIEAEPTSSAPVAVERADGQLEIRGYLWRDSTSKAGWVRRYTEVKKDMLAFYKSADKGKVKNAISVKRISSIVVSSAAGGAIDSAPEPTAAAVTDPAEDDGADPPTGAGEFAMVVSGSEYRFRTEAPADAARWVELLNRVRDAYAA